MPIGRAKNDELLWPPKSLGTMALANTEMSERHGAQGWERVATTVALPWAFSDLIAKSRKLSGPFLSVPARKIEKTTSSAATGRPSENLMPGRSAKVQVFPSELTVWPCASHGTSWPAGLVMYSGSKILSSV